MVFEEEFTHPKVVFQVAGDQLEFHLQATQGMKGETRANSQQVEEKWKPPPKGTMKLNRDAAIDKHKKMMGFGDVVWDYTGGVVAT
jgi:hypothetical protein